MFLYCSVAMAQVVLLMFCGENSCRCLHAKAGQRIQAAHVWPLSQRGICPRQVGLRSSLFLCNFCELSPGAPEHDTATSFERNPTQVPPCEGCQRIQAADIWPLAKHGVCPRQLACAQIHALSNAEQPRKEYSCNMIFSKSRPESSRAYSMAGFVHW